MGGANQQGAEQVRPARQKCIRVIDYDSAEVCLAKIAIKRMGEHQGDETQGERPTQNQY